MSSDLTTAPAQLSTEEARVVGAQLGFLAGLPLGQAEREEWPSLAGVGEGASGGSVDDVAQRGVAPVEGENEASGREPDKGTRVKGAGCGCAAGSGAGCRR